MASANVYTAVAQSPSSWTTAGPVLHITVPASATAGASKSIEIVRVAVTQQTSSATGSTNQMGLALKRATGAWTATSPTTITPGVVNGAEAVAGSMAKATVAAFGTSPADGTGATTLWQEGFNILAGWPNIPVPEERITISSGHFFTVNLTGTVPAATYVVSVAWREYA